MAAGLLPSKIRKWRVFVCVYVCVCGQSALKSDLSFCKITIGSHFFKDFGFSSVQDIDVVVMAKTCVCCGKLNSS